MAKSAMFASIMLLLVVVAAVIVTAGPSARCRYQASRMNGFEPEKWAGVWFGDSTTEDSSRWQCGLWNSSLIESPCNSPKGGCMQSFVWAVKEQNSPSSVHYYPGMLDQTEGKAVGSYYGAYYDTVSPYFTRNWYTIDAWVLDTDYNTYSAVYFCERDNMQEVNADQVFFYARKKQGLGNDVRNRLLQRLKAKYNWNFSSLNAINNSNCSFQVGLTLN